MCVANASTGSNKVFLCPNTTICTSDYFNCDRIDDKYCNSATEFRFRCFDTGTDACVKDLRTECCPPVGGKPRYYCPHTKACVDTESSCCSINPATPIFCKSLNKCVAHQYECCSNYLSSVNPMVKCTYENKCVPSDTNEFCFQPFRVECSDPRYPYQCLNDGTCRRSATYCPTPKVCPPGYF